MALNAHWNNTGEPRTVTLGDLEHFIAAAVGRCGMPTAHATTFTDVLVRATMRGVGHHDVHDLPLRLEALSTREINPDPDIRVIGGNAALTVCDGDNGPGELCSVFAMDQACGLAERYGIGLCTIRNSNHFLATAPYLEMAAEKGYLAMIFSRNKPSMGLPGSGKKTIGNMPFGFASPAGLEDPILLDACLAYASYGALAAKGLAGEPVPATWGTDAAGGPTTDPRAIIDGIPAPIGGHKGLGLAMLVELLTSGLAGGCLLGERNPAHPNGRGIHGQTAIVIKPDGLHGGRSYVDGAHALAAGLTALGPPVRLPGQVSGAAKRQAAAAGSVVLKTGVLDELDQWAQQLGVDRLPHTALA